MDCYPDYEGWYSCRGGKIGAALGYMAYCAPLTYLFLNNSPHPDNPVSIAMGVLAGATFSSAALVFGYPAIFAVGLTTIGNVAGHYTEEALKLLLEAYSKPKTNRQINVSSQPINANPPNSLESHLDHSLKQGPSWVRFTI